MTTTRFEGPVASGDIPNNYSIGTTNYTANVGLAVLTQSAVVTAASATTATTVIYLPQQSQILGLFVNTQTAWATTASIQLGTLTTATAYLATALLGTSVGQTGFFNFTGAVNNIGTTPGVMLTVTGTASETSGLSIVTLEYVQTTSTYS
jgi:hypothetical protein